MTIAILGATTLISLLATDGNGFRQDREPTVEQAARVYRIQAYERFRTTRGQYDAQRAVGDKLWQLWLNAGEPADQATAVVRWYDEASQATPPAELPPLPTLPKLEPKLPAEAATPAADQAQPAPQSPTPDPPTAAPSREALGPQTTTEQKASSPKQTAPPASRQTPARPAAGGAPFAVLRSMGKAVLRAASVQTR